MPYEGFALQKYNIGIEERAVMGHCIINRIPIKICSMSEEVPHSFIPVGSVKWCERSLSAKATTPNYYPDFLKDHLYRKVWRTDKWPLGEKVFIKPADKHKRFTGFVTTGGYRKKKRGPYWCSDPVSFINEWRYYVADGKILVGEWYSGDEINTPVAPDLHIQIPNDFCGSIDFGVTRDGCMALVEVHPPYACGWYGKENHLFVEWLKKGWEYLNRNEVIASQT